MQTIEQTATTQSLPITFAPTKWTIDPAHTSVTFGVKHMMVSTVRGEFQKITGTVLWDPSRPEASSIEATIDVASINTREEKRDAHLRSADFFDVEKFPTIEFKSRGVGRKKDGAVEVLGDLTIHGVTRVVALEVEGPTTEHADPWGFIRIGASARAVIRRSDFGMTWNTLLEAGGVVVGDEIKLQLEVELQRKP
jgi:polyisoprenoid-binding protein YceI